MKIPENVISVIIIAIFIMVSLLCISNNLSPKYTYTIGDITLALEYIKGNVQLDDETFELYDINKDNEVNVQDIILMNNIIRRRKSIMNLIMLKGRLARDIDLKYAQTTNTAIAGGSIAVQRRFVKEGDVDVDFFNFTAFGKQAETMSKFLKKGSEVVIQGRLQTRSWEDNEGKKRYATDVIVDSFEFCGKKEENSTSNNIPTEVNVVENNDSDDLPF